MKNGTLVEKVDNNRLLDTELNLVCSRGTLYSYLWRVLPELRLFRKAVEFFTSFMRNLYHIENELPNFFI